jgi:hypothetical protein
MWGRQIFTHFQLFVFHCLLNSDYPVTQGKQIPGTGSPWRLSFVRRCQMFLIPQFGNCLISSSFAQNFMVAPTLIFFENFVHPCCYIFNNADRLLWQSAKKQAYKNAELFQSSIFETNKLSNVFRNTVEILEIWFVSYRLSRNFALRLQVFKGAYLWQQQEASIGGGSRIFTFYFTFLK